MTDISKKKEEAKKNIRALLISAPLGLTFTELNRDYQDFLGAPLPGKEFGYNSAQEFIQDIPDVAQAKYQGGNLVLKAVADSTTKHIEKMVSKQKIDSKKQMKVNAKRSAATSRSGPGMSRLNFMPAPGTPYKPPFRRPQSYNNNSSSSNNRPVRGGHVDHQRSYNNNSHQNNQNSNRVPPRFNRQHQAHHRTVPFVPSHIQNNIHDLVFQHREGLPLTHFSRIFRARYQIHLNPNQLGFQDEYDLLASIPNIVSLKRFQQGEMRVLPAGAPGDGRLNRDRHQSGENNKSSYSSSFSPPHQETSAKDRRSPSPKAKDKDEDWDDLLDKETCNNIPVYVQERIEKLINGRPEGIKASCLLFEYKKLYQTELQMKSYGYNSAIEFVSDLGHIVRSERPNKFDWVLYPAKTKSSGPGSKNQGADASKKSDGFSAQKNFDLKSAPPPLSSLTFGLLASHKVEWEVKEAICQVLSLNPKGVPLEKFVDTYEEMTGRQLQVEQYGVNSVKGFVHSLSDILYIMLDVSDQPVVCLIHDSGPRKFDLLKDKYKPITPAPKPQPLTESERRKQQLKQAFPPQAVTPGCYYKAQPIIYLDTGAASQKSYIEVFVSFTTDPGNFWVQLRGNDTTMALEDLMDALEEFYGDPSKASHSTKEKDYHMTPEFAKPGMVCATIYPEDLYWHRGIITGCKDNLYEVFYVDYGNTCYVSLENIRFLKSKFILLPAQAIRARLSNVQPMNKKWSVRARQRFLDLTRERPLLGFVTAFKNRVLSMCLTDTSGEDDLHINDIMTEEGYAQFTPDTDDCLKVEDKQTHTQILTNDFLYGTPQQAGGATAASARQKGGAPSHGGDPHKKSSSTTQEHGEPTMGGGGGGGGGDVGVSWRRYVRQAQMSDEHIFNLIFLGGKDLYLMSSEISSLFFQDDIISAKLRSDKTDIPKVVVTKEEYPDLYAELLSYEIPAVANSTSLLSLFPLKALPLMMEMYGKDSSLEEIKNVVFTIIEWFDPMDPYWKGEDDQTSESGDLDEDDDTATDCQSVVSDSKDSFKLDDLHTVYKMLQMKRNRCLKRFLEGGGCTESEVNTMHQVEMDIRGVKAIIESLENKKSTDEPKKQGATEDVNDSSKSATTTTSYPSTTQLHHSQPLPPPPQQKQQQHLQPNPITTAPITATVAPTPKLTSSSLSSTTAASSSASAFPPSAMMAGFGGLGGGGIGAGRGFITGGGGLPGFGGTMGGAMGNGMGGVMGNGMGGVMGNGMAGTMGSGMGASMDMGEMLRQQMSMNSLLMSQMGMMGSTPMMPSLPLSMEQMQQQQALLQQQMLVQQQQQQQLLLRCQQQQNSRPTLLPSSSTTLPPSSLMSLSSSSTSSSTIPQGAAPGFSHVNPTMRAQLLSKLSNTGASSSSSTTVSPTVTAPPPPLMGNNNNNMFCASLGRVLSSALNDQTNYPTTSTALSQQQGQGTNVRKMNLNK